VQGEVCDSHQGR